jgi:hypothetical protein
MDFTAHAHAHRAALLGQSYRAFGVALAARFRLERAAPEWPSTPARRESHPHLESQEVAGIKKSLRGKDESSSL